MMPDRNNGQHRERARQSSPQPPIAWSGHVSHDDRSAQMNAVEAQRSFWSIALKRLLILTVVVGILFVATGIWDYNYEYISFEEYDDGTMETINHRMPIPLYVLVVVFFFAWLIGVVLVFWRAWSKTQRSTPIQSGSLSKEHLRDAILRRYQKRFWVSFLMYSLVMVLLIIAVFMVKDSRIWFANDPWFETLYVMKVIFPYVMATIWIGGVAVLFFWQWRQSASDIVELVDSIELMQTGEEGRYIEVPDNLAELQPVLQDMFDHTWEDRYRLAEVEKRKNDLILYLAHDLKTPLTSTVGYLNLLKDSDELTEKQREAYTEIALDKALRLESLIDQFFEISRFNFQDIVLNRSDFSLNLLLDQLVEEFYPLLDDSGKDIRIEADENILVSADADRLARALNNILRNAISYGAPHATIMVRAHEQGGQVTVSITNHGETIPAERLDQVFEKFFRLDEARSTEAGGAGLGLAIAKEIIERHHGTISATSEYGETTFTVVVPREVRQ